VRSGNLEFLDAAHQVCHTIALFQRIEKRRFRPENKHSRLCGMVAPCAGPAVPKPKRPPIRQNRSASAILLEVPSGNTRVVTELRAGVDTVFKGWILW